jgi:ABC-type polysaccharide transport system permease subunit
MTQAFVLLLWLFLILSLVGLGLGFFRPVYVLWFLDRFNRLKVLKIYGTLSLLFYVLYLTLSRWL